MKKSIFIFSLMFILAAENAEARKCLEGAVFDADENGQARLVDCAKWEREPEAVLAEQAAINAYTDKDFDESQIIIVPAEDNEPPVSKAIGSVQNKIDNIWHSIYSAIFD